MSYLVLARKWRPKRFEELAGQEHVVRALVNALNTGRVHHAFLFTGTRGVGKTTIARIFAKSLNCETGVSANPCGVCSTCREVDEGRFVDLMEVDAASRTKVDDTRELLDDVQYMPTRGRYKVYLIDEVHMLSTHSFNALLKTLEEPPPHVKFLLATTDPQKLPVTVLSRCLQFNLKRLPPGVISKRIVEILGAENISYEQEAVRMIAQSAEGSMRDALSLLDQAIAYNGDALKEEATRAMLGTIDRRQVISLAQALSANDAREMLNQVAALDERAPDYREVLAELAALLQKLALVQAVPDLDLDDADDLDALTLLAGAFTPEDVQLCYQIAITSRRDLELAPDARGGFEMALLRMIAFRQPSEGAGSTGAAPARPVSSAAPVTASSTSATSSASARPRVALNSAPGNDWQSMVRQMNLSGPVSQLAAHCTLQSRSPGRVELLLDAAGEVFRNTSREERLRESLSTVLGEEVHLDIVTLVHAALDTPARRSQADADDRQQAAIDAINNDPAIRQMQELFGATVQMNTVKPLQ